MDSLQHERTPLKPYGRRFMGRLIGTVRRALEVLLKKPAGSQLNDEAFRTFMTEVENIVNSRPQDAPEPLTPNNLLTMKPNIVMLPPSRKFQCADLYSRV